MFLTGLNKGKSDDFFFQFFRFLLPLVRFVLGSDEELVDPTVEVVARSSRSSRSARLNSSVDPVFAASDSSCKRMFSFGNCLFVPVVVKFLWRRDKEDELEELGSFVSPEL